MISPKSSPFRFAGRKVVRRVVEVDISHKKPPLSSKNGNSSGHRDNGKHNGHHVFPGPKRIDLEKVFNSSLDLPEEVRVRLLHKQHDRSPLENSYVLGVSPTMIRSRRELAEWIRGANAKYLFLDHLTPGNSDTVRKDVLALLKLMNEVRPALWAPIVLGLRAIPEADRDLVRANLARRGMTFWDTDATSFSKHVHATLVCVNTPVDSVTKSNVGIKPTTRRRVRSKIH